MHDDYDSHTFNASQKWCTYGGHNCRTSAWKQVRQVSLFRLAHFFCSKRFEQSHQRAFEFSLFEVKFVYR